MDSGRNETLSYDALSRLTSTVTKGSSAYAQWGLSFTYDRYGNRTAQNISAGCVVPMTCPTNSLAVDPTTNHVTNTGFQYDANGNMTNDGQNTLTYDGENRVATAGGGLGSGTYTYDGSGLRVKKVSGGTTTVYAFSGSKVIAEYVNGAGPSSPTREYIYAGNLLLTKIESGNTVYYHQDLLSNRVVSNNSGSAIEQLGTFPFGESWYNATSDKLLFTSYERDSESGNDYALARYDLSRLGRFLTPDPVAGDVTNPQGLNRYSYARNDAVNLVDPSGMFIAPQLYLVTRMMAAHPFGFNWNEFDMLIATDREGDQYWIKGAWAAYLMLLNARRPVYCEPSVLKAISDAWRRALLANTSQVSAGGQKEAGFSVDMTKGGDIKPITLGGGMGSDANGSMTLTVTPGSTLATFHTHLTGTGLPSTPNNNVSGSSDNGDTLKAVQTHVDFFVISANGLSVAPASSENPVTGDDSGWIVQGKNFGDWYKALKALCEQYNQK